MHIRLSDEMLKTIAQRVHEAHASRSILDVYTTAESIRLENVHDNTAREDIIEKLVMLASAAYVPLEFNKREFESEQPFYDAPTFLVDGLNSHSSAEGETIH
jgi:hypothetical protein